MIEVILTKDVDNLGHAGEVVRVRPGYGRNYLFPRGLALLATKGNVASLEHHKRQIAAEQARIKAEHEAMAAKLKAVSVSIARPVGDGDRLFGSVSSRDIVDALSAQNIVVDRRVVRLPEPLKEIGPHEVEIRFSADVSATLRVNVVAVRK
jgi:large subunit ribosomal protein L9